MVSALETIMWTTAFKCCFQIQLAPLHHGPRLLAGAAAGSGRGGGRERGGGGLRPHGVAVQVDPIKTRVESAHSFSA